MEPVLQMLGSQRKPRVPQMQPWCHPGDCPVKEKPHMQLEDLWGSHSSSEQLPGANSGGGMGR